MKKLTVIYGLLTSLLLTACGGGAPGSELTALCQSLGVDVRRGTVVAQWDDHGGFLGDGTAYMRLQFSDENCLTAIRQASGWKQLPLSENLTALVYGFQSGSASIGPYLDDENGEPLIPEIQNGYYYFYDRHSESQDPLDDTDVLSRNSYNFTIAIYDADSHTLYYCEFDT